ncbi:unnamed protein product [Anisakis simplex]|uniref:HMG box domain-containing protein n=1 Tax=Anisakis simplex TaxID=6269 RepID=A0A0M3JBV0_ANISI|nr:unnamed protein product [Anisakis simplex]
MDRDFEQKWKKMIDSDKRQLYSDMRSLSTMSQNEETALDSNVRTAEQQSSTESSTKSEGTMTDVHEKKEWGDPRGEIDFNPIDSRGYISKGIQVRGQVKENR